MIRRAVVLLCATVLMLALYLVVSGVQDFGPHPFSVAAIGFVLLVAFSIGEGAKVLGLPSVTGYIATGLALSPLFAELFGPRLIGDISFFNTLALSLIAMTAGLELDARSVARVARTLFLSIVYGVPLLLVLVGGGLVLWQVRLPIEGVATFEGGVVLALIFAVLSLATSMAVALAVVSEHRSKGRYTDLVLGMPVAKDVVTVIGLAILVPFANASITGAPADGGLFMHILGELGLSLLAGAIIGAALIAYVRLVGRELLVFTVAVLLGVSELVRNLQLELLLVFITAGAVVRNFSPYETDLLQPLRKVALPIFVVFFTTAGANVDLSATLAVLPVAALISGARALAFFLAHRAAASREGPGIREHGWLGFLPQSAVNIGLTVLAAREVPALREAILSIGMAVVALHLLVGPVLLSFAIRRSGESALSSGPAPARREAAALVPVAAPPDPDPDLVDIGGALETLVTRFCADESSRSAAEASVGHALASPRSREPEAWEEARRLLGDDLHDRVALLYRDVARIAQGAPLAVVRQPLPLRGPTSMKSVLARVRRLLRRAAGRREVVVPLRSLVRSAVEPRFARALVVVQATRLRLRVRILQGVKAALDGKLGLDALEGQLAALARETAERLRGELERALADALTDAAVLAAGARSSLRVPPYSVVEPEVAVWLARLESDGPEWQPLILASLDGARAAEQLQAIREGVTEVAASQVHEPLAELRRELERGAALVRARVDELRAAVDEWRLSGTVGDDPLNVTREGRAVPRPSGGRGLVSGTHPTVGPVTESNGHGEDAALERLAARAQNVASVDALATFRGARSRFRRAGQSVVLRERLVALVGQCPERLVLLAGELPLPGDAVSGSVARVSIELRARAEALLLDDVTRTRADALQPVMRSTGLIPVRLKQAVAALSYTLELARGRRFDDEQTRHEALSRAIERLAADVEEALLGPLAAVESARRSVQSALDVALSQLQDELRPEGVESATRWPRAIGWAIGMLRSVGDWGNAAGREMGGRVAGRWRQLLSRPGLLDRQLESGRLTLDSSALRAYLALRFPPVEAALPPPFARALTLEALSDRREATAHQEALQRVVADVTSPDWTEPHSVLVVGHHGSGRSTLLNLAQLRFVGARVIRLDEALAHRHRGPVAALAAELGTPEDAQGVADALRVSRTVLIVDNLEHWLSPSPEGVAALAAFLSTFTLAGPDVRWLVSTSTLARDALDELTPFSSTFRRVVTLPALDADELERVIRARERLTGWRFDYSAIEPLVGWLPFVHIGSDRYFRALARRSHGILRAALAAHVAALDVRDERTVDVALPPPPTLPFLRQLRAESRAALRLLCTFGPLDLELVSQGLGTAVDRAMAVMAELVAGGLVEGVASHGVESLRDGRASGGGQRYRLVPRLEGFIEQSLGGPV